MVWNLENVGVEELFEMGAIVEQSGFDFYARLSARTDVLRVQNELKFLRDEEGLHRAWFLEQLRQRGVAPKGMVAAPLRALLEQEFFAPLDRMFASSDIRDNDKTLRFGSSLEQKSIELYEGMRPRVTDPQRADLERIIAQKEGHRRKLESLRLPHGVAGGP